MNRILTVVLASALLCAPALADTLGEMRAKYGITRGFNASDKPVPNFTSGLRISGSDLTVGEFGVLDGVTAGTTTASKALVVDADKKLDGGLLGKLLYSTVAASTAFGGSGANVEAAFSTGSYSVAANSLSIGDVVKVRVAVTIPTTVSTDTLAINLRVGGLAGTVVATLPATNVSNDDLVVFDVSIAIRTSTTAYASATLVGTTGGTPGAGAKVTALTGLDLTASIALTVSAVWSTENANACSLQQFIVTKN